MEVYEGHCDRILALFGGGGVCLLLFVLLPYAMGSISLILVVMLLMLIWSKSIDCGAHGKTSIKRNTSNVIFTIEVTID